MNSKYTITIKKMSTADVVVGYDMDGMLVLIEIKTSGLTENQTNWIKSMIPAWERALNDLSTTYNFIKVEAIPVDLTFNTFWDKYAHKVGNRTRAYTLWSGLQEPEKIKCMASITRYNQWLAQRPRMERLYPETYLSQKRFNNEFII